MKCNEIEEEEEEKEETAHIYIYSIISKFINTLLYYLSFKRNYIKYKLLPSIIKSLIRQNFTKYLKYRVKNLNSYTLIHNKTKHKSFFENIRYDTLPKINQRNVAPFLINTKPLKTLLLNKVI